MQQLARFVLGALIVILCRMGEDVESLQRKIFLNARRHKISLEPVFRTFSVRCYLPPWTLGIKRISAFGSNSRIKTSRFSEMSAANHPCATFSLNSLSISVRRCALTVSVSHSARVLSPPAQIILSFFNAMVVPALEREVLFEVLL